MNPELTTPPSTLPAGLSFGPLALTVASLEHSLGFYQTTLGFEPRPAPGGSLRLGLPGGPDLLELVENPGAQTRPAFPGLYHFALLLPSRLELARAFYRLLETRYPLQGFADHLVSEAIYLADPDGIGIELYRDRPKEEWPLVNGRLEMSNAPLDSRGLLNELAGQPEADYTLHPGTRIGHLHLKVSDLPRAEAFYVDLLGFDLMQRYGRQAAFVSAGGYHHHLGMNTWESAGSPPPPPDTAGLRHFILVLPSPVDVRALLERISTRAAALQPPISAPLAREDGTFWLSDPSGNALQVTRAA
jgi:catechol 2,3-dioxygenase